MKHLNLVEFRRVEVWRLEISEDEEPVWAIVTVNDSSQQLVPLRGSEAIRFAPLDKLGAAGARSR